MNCQDIANLLDDGQIVELTSARQAQIDGHLAGCESCAHEWRAARALRSWQELPMPSARPGLFAEAMQRATQQGVSPARRHEFWIGTGVGGALAAGILIAIMILRPALEQNAVDGVPALTIALNEPHDVSVAIDSSEALMGAQIRVVLTGGIQLVGFDDQSVLSWTTDLDRGANRLTLPVVAVGSDGGQVLVEVAHERKRQIFVVDVGVASTVSHAPTESNEPELSAGLQNAPATVDRSSNLNTAEPHARSDV
ncbi:MAG: hypothetical protein GWN29_01240 [Gammaproteobacteria bacterium]|nr:hypothetical protein [Gammaproteobacteria bacterium]